ncbi:hypothetical protein F5Y15DRAFT_415407 [Xylariaceae sp. FL0016]|nr:hypothetical protein F5Y15DRAFT_415407 [Xylariaceae sp. FL0016]
MVASAVPAAIRIILHILTVITFIPQYVRIMRVTDAGGISMVYALLNAISFTEEFTICLLSIVSFSDEPVSPGLDGWCDFIQFVLALAGQVGIFILIVVLPGHRLGSRLIALLLYIVYLMLAIIPVAVPAIASPWKGSDSLVGVVHGVHTLIANPIITILGLGGAIFAQAREISRQPSPGALDVLTLESQAVVFAILAICWPWRLVNPSDDAGFVSWYRFVGWPCVHSAIFAIGQGVLWWKAMNRAARIGGADLTATPETEPLLRTSSTAGEPLSESR